MYKFLGYIQSNRNLHPGTVEKIEQMASELIEKNPPQLDVGQYMVTVGEYKYRGASFQLLAYYYGDDFDKMRFIFYHNGKKEIVMYLRRP